MKNTFLNWAIGVSTLAAVFGCLHYDGPFSHWPAVFGATFIGTAFFMAIGYIAVIIENHRK